MSEEIKNLKDIKQVLASVLDEIKTWSDGQPSQPIQNDINEKDVANTQLDPSRIDQTKPGGAGNHTKEDRFDFLTKQVTACMNACMAMADMMSSHNSRLNYHRGRMDNMKADMDDMYSNTKKKMDDHMGPNSGHLPPAKSPSQMSKAIKALGMDGDYTVEKKTVYASKDLFEIKKPSKS